MGETVAAIATAASVVGSGVQIFSGLSQASAAKGQADVQRQQLEEERESARVQAVVDEAEHRKELASVLATQRAVRAGRGVELYSETFRNIQDRTIADAEADISLGQLNALRRQRRLGLGIDQAEAQGNQGAMAGYGAAFSGVKGLGGVAKEMWPKQPGRTE